MALGTFQSNSLVSREREAKDFAYHFQLFLIAKRQEPIGQAEGGRQMMVGPDSNQFVR